MENNSFLDELAEDMRQEKLVKIYNKYAAYIYGVVIGVVVLVGGNGIWDYYKHSQRVAMSDRYAEALKFEEKKDIPQAISSLDTIAKASQSDHVLGYRILAQFHQAALYAKSTPKGSQPHQALAIYRNLMNDQSIPAMYRDVASYLHGLHSLHAGGRGMDYDLLLKTLTPLTVPESGFRYLALELLAHVERVAGHHDKARAYCNQVLLDPLAQNGDISDRCKALVAMLPESVANGDGGGVSNLFQKKNQINKK